MDLVQFLPRLESQSLDTAVIEIGRKAFSFKTPHLLDLRKLLFYVSFVLDLYLDLLKNIGVELRTRNVDLLQRFIRKLRPLNKVNQLCPCV